MKIGKSIRHQLKVWLLSKQCRHIVLQLQPVLYELRHSIPVIVISYNNGTYVRNITIQLNRFNIKPIIIDNNSTADKSKSILTELETTNFAYIIRSHRNFGHQIGFLQPIYHILPEVFCYTDPDLQFNSNLPENFIETLINLTLEFPVYKIGFALALRSHGPLRKTKFHSRHFKPFFYERYLSIEEFESRYWINRLQYNNLELYAASIDTTFAVYRKSNYFGDFYSAIRVAGDYSALHLPWFDKVDLFNDEERESYKRKNKSSNWI